MSQDPSATSIDLIRWTFTVNPDHRAEIEGHLVDLGLDVFVTDDAQFIVTWEEPDREVEEIVEEIWALNGAPFDITQEEFQRLSLSTLHHADDEPAQDAA